MRRILRIISLVFVGVCCLSVVYGQGGKIVQRIFLVGDGGELKDGHHPVCDWLKQHVDWNDTSNVLVYLGDNVYPHGMPAEGSKDLDEAKKILDYQISVVAGKKARAFFVPGNHDWKQGKPGGWQQVRNEEDYVESLGMPNVDFLPKDGCPGPVAVAVGDKTVLVAMDSQWWLQDDQDKPGTESGCDCKDSRSITNALRDIISTYPDKLIVLAMHHPLYTHGEHGGYYTIKQHLFPLTDLKPGLWIPLPLIGSIYPIVRGVFGNVQDVHNPRYKDFREKIEAVIAGHSNVVHVAGHEHTLQLLQHDSVYYVVSGAGSKNTRVKMGEYSLMAKEDYGFSVIEVREDGKSEIKFYSAAATDLGQSFYTASIPALRPKPNVEELARTWPDSVTVAGDSAFLASGFKRWWLGSNYRKEWSVPIKVKVFDMTGWTPLERGGGHQTRSLRMKNAQGEQYVIRGIKKYVTEDALPVAVKNDPLVQDLVSDGVSASYPYAALSVPMLATAAGVPHATPRLVYVPDDPRLGKFRSDYGNLFAFIEEREPGNGKKTYNMTDIEKKLFQDNDNTLDQHRALRARLLDMFMMDFDRHEDQWRWEAEDNGKGKTFAPVPRDRDQPFFINEGILPWIAGSAFLAPQLQGFRPKARNIKTFNFNARNFDRNYLNELSEKDWREDAERVNALMTDSLIEASLHQQPVQIQSYSMNSIIAKLKERRKYYIGDMMTYYRFLSKQVEVFGSDKNELFDVERKGDDSVTVTVYKLGKDGKPGKQIYGRTFVSEVTRELRLYGMGGDDQFHTHGQGGGRIVVRIIGGAGNDVYQNDATSAAVKTKIYDLNTEKNVFEGQGNYREFMSSDPSVNAVNRLGYKYNVLTPLLNLGYNPDDGVFLGVMFRYVTQGFHKDPYKQLHSLSLLHALSTKAYAFKYNFEAIHAIGTTDLLFDADVRAPENTINFFGLGNETFYDKSAKDGIRYYRARFNSYDVDLLIRKRWGPAFSFALGPVFQYFTLDSADNKGRFITQTAQNGLNPAELYSSKAFAGGRASLVIDNRNDKIFTSRGMYWETRFSSLGNLNDNSHAYSQLNSDLSVYMSFNTRANVVLASRVGYGKTFGNYEFYQAQFLGGLDNLRGYRKYRFAGDELFYHNLDLRVKLAEFQTYLFPGSLGLQFFNDIGRVWRDGEKSNEWHDGYGGGLWISPLKKFVFSASYGQGTDGGIVLLKLGFQY
ncbi:MAG: BamA/TamA family outer membrane protein [Bacteroidetes bacterium]|nr:BamA/TamA family outer membrane protein [Bacteroidota bacterium]